MSQENRTYMDIAVLLDMAVFGQTDTIATILKLSPGYDVNQKSKTGNFLAIFAAQHNDFRFLKLLVRYGARLDQKDGMGRTVMGWAKKHNNQAMIDFIERSLMSSAIDENCTDSDSEEARPNKKQRVP